MRSALLLDWNEWAVLQLGPDQKPLVINPKQCVVCLEAPREVKFDECGHYVVCKGCAAKAATCPLCRAPNGGLLDVEPQQQSYGPMFSEVRGDLFSSRASLGHCVSACFKMGAGIAK